MQYERIYADGKGHTHFEQATLKLDEADYRPPAPMLFVSHARQAGTLQFIRLPSGWAGDGVCPPQHQFFICQGRQPGREVAYARDVLRRGVQRRLWPDRYFDHEGATN
jgi:hypothetical protein